MENEIFEELIGMADYALASRSLTLVHEAYGAAKMARELDAITGEQFWELNEKLVKNGINNPAAKLI